ncbi:MAG: hypothetical protein ACN4G0_00195 [Polyangiales bacterium]
MKRRIATLIAVVGAVIVGNQLAGVWPRDVEVAYTVDSTVDAIDVDYLQEGVAAASARFEQSEPKTSVIRHTVRLQPGEYQARIILYGPDGNGAEHVRRLLIPSDGLTRFDLRGTAERAE